MSKRILPQYELVRGHEMKQAVFQALGYASMCWSETPSGVFESEKASQVGKELMGVIVQFAKNYATLDRTLLCEKCDHSIYSHDRGGCCSYCRWQEFGECYEWDSNEKV